MESTTKDLLRKEFRIRRNQLKTTQRQQYSRQITKVLLNNADIFNQANNIALYWSHNSEVTTDAILEACLTQQKNCYLPIIAPDDNQLFFQQITTITPKFSKKNRGILELAHDPELQILTAQLDLVLVPMLAFNQNNIRLGMGAGHYDKTFSFKKNSPNTKPILVGLAYDIQYTDKISRDIWDIPLDYIITETGIKICNTG